MWILIPKVVIFVAILSSVNGYVHKKNSLRSYYDIFKRAIDYSEPNYNQYKKADFECVKEKINYSKSDRIYIDAELSDRILEIAFDLCTENVVKDLINLKLEIAKKYIKYNPAFELCCKEELSKIDPNSTILMSLDLPKQQTYFCTQSSIDFFTNSLIIFGNTICESNISYKSLNLKLFLISKSFSWVKGLEINNLVEEFRLKHEDSLKCYMKPLISISTSGTTTTTPKTSESESNSDEYFEDTTSRDYSSIEINTGEQETTVADNVNSNNYESISTPKKTPVRFVYDHDYYDEFKSTSTDVTTESVFDQTKRSSTLRHSNTTTKPPTVATRVDGHKSSVDYNQGYNNYETTQNDDFAEYTTMTTNQDADRYKAMTYPSRLLHPYTDLPTKLPTTPPATIDEYSQSRKTQNKVNWGYIDSVDYSTKYRDFSEHTTAMTTKSPPHMYMTYPPIAYPYPYIPKDPSINPSTEFKSTTTGLTTESIFHRTKETSTIRPADTSTKPPTVFIKVDPKEHWLFNNMYALIIVIINATLTFFMFMHILWKTSNKV